jgi:hypothetical protein
MVTKSADMVVLPPNAVALPKKKSASPALAGLAMINKLLTAELVEATVRADRFRNQVQTEGHVYPLDHSPMHRSWLPHIVEAVEARDVIQDLTFPRFELSQADASAMLHYLFGAMGKRRNDEAAAKLMACIDIFSPASNALGSALGLWESAPTHPVILAIAIKQLMAAKTFEPAETELREALATVNQRMKMLSFWVGEWLKRLDDADERVFRENEPAWRETYANVTSKVPLWMAEQCELAGEGPCEDTDENGNPEFSPSPRWQALNALWETKHEAEQAAERAAESKARIAACEMKPAKRTRKMSPLAQTPSREHNQNR